MNTTEQPKKEVKYETLEELKKRLAVEKARLKEEEEKSLIKNELGMIDRQKKHPRLAAFAKGMKSFFSSLARIGKATGKGLGKGLGNVAKNLNESDKRLAEQRRLAQAAQPWQKPKARPVAKEKKKAKVQEQPQPNKSLSAAASEAANIIPVY